MKDCTMPGDKLLIYLMRRDLRVADNPILHHLATTPDHGFTHLLPVYVFPSHQIEVSGFLKIGESSPYPRAVSSVGKFWRCGPHRAKFIAQSVWDLKANFEAVASGLALRVGSAADVLTNMIQHFNKTGPSVGAVWMTEEPSVEEIQEQDDVAAVCTDYGVEFKLWADEKYFIDDRDTGLAQPSDLPDVFTTYRKSQEPLRQRPRQPLAAPQKSTLPPLPDRAVMPPQEHPFVMPHALEGLISRLHKPMDKILTNPPAFPHGTESSHPFHGGETRALERVRFQIRSGGVSTYQFTRNGLAGLDYSTKFSAYLALGCISARQIHAELLKFENGTDIAYAQTHGYGRGENEGTRGVRFELLWRDYMRLCTKKFGHKLFEPSGFRQDEYQKTWMTPNQRLAAPDQDPSPDRVARMLERFLEGTTGMGLIDASQRELFHTGYTSNRARQNVANFFCKHLEIDWRYGAEWYEMMLIDHDVSSNWANWQYVAGVGNDPRGDTRIFNPVKQGFDYDFDGSYVRAWVPELRNVTRLSHLFQIWTAGPEELSRIGLLNNVMVKDPLKRIEFALDHKPARQSRSGHWRGGGRGGSRVSKSREHGGGHGGAHRPPPANHHGQMAQPNTGGMPPGAHIQSAPNAYGHGQGHGQGRGGHGHGRGGHGQGRGGHGQGHGGHGQGHGGHGHGHVQAHGNVQGHGHIQGHGHVQGQAHGFGPGHHGHGHYAGVHMAGVHGALPPFHTGPGIGPGAGPGGVGGGGGAPLGLPMGVFGGGQHFAHPAQHPFLYPLHNPGM